MSLSSTTDLRTALAAAVRSDGRDGLTTAQDVRDFLGLVLSELETAQAPRLEFVFGSGYADSYTATCGSAQAGHYTSQRASNVASASYVRNGTDDLALPFELAADDTLAVTIVRTEADQPTVLGLLAS